MEIWAAPDHESFDEETSVAFSTELEEMSIEQAALSLRCVASPQWGKRPSQMDSEERERLLGVLRQHNARKRGDSTDESAIHDVEEKAAS